MNKLASVLTALAVICFFAAFANAELNIGGDIKVLGVYTDNVTDFSDDEGDDNDDFMRVETHLFFTADLSDNVTTKVSIEADRDFDYSVERSFESDEYYYEGDYSSFGDLYLFLEEAWIQMAYLYDSGFNVKLGRQFVQFGDGFIIGDSQVANPFFLSDLGEYEVDPFDAVLVWFDGDDWILNLLAAKSAETREMDRDADLYALYFTYSGVEDYVFDLYFTFNNFQNTPIMDSPLAILDDYGYLDASVYNVGARVAGSAVENLTYKLEGTYQFGEVGEDGDVKAWAVEAGLKYMFDVEYNPYIGFTYVFKSGDDDEGDDDLENYLGLFENRVYGEIFDPWTNAGNLHIFNLAGGIDASEDISLGAKYYYFLAQEDEQWYGEDNLGHELDLYLDYQFNQETKAILAGGVFLPEDGVEEAYGNDDVAWFVRGGVKVEF